MRTPEYGPYARDCVNIGEVHLNDYERGYVAAMLLGQCVDSGALREFFNSLPAEARNDIRDYLNNQTICGHYYRWTPPLRLRGMDVPPEAGS